VSQDGNLYVIDASGRERERVFLTRTLSAAGAPMAIDAEGRVYAQNNGELHILGH
jgi:hypothetical protein